MTTDGFRLSRKALPIESIGDMPSGKAIIPKLALTEIPRIAQEEETLAIQFLQSEAQVVFASGSTILSSRILEGEFPPFERIIPKETPTKVMVGRQELHSAIKLASVIARDAGYLGKLTIGEGELVVSAQNPKSGTQETKVDAQILGEKLEILFNLRFIDEFLGSVTGNDIELGLKDTSSACVFRDPRLTNYLHLIMPVRLQG